RELDRRQCAEIATSALNVELERLATTDGLTGLSNRRRFDEVLAREWLRAVRTSQPLSLILLDADSFKGFNDRYGHQKGDEALKLIARSMEAVISRSAIPDTASAARSLLSSSQIRAKRVPRSLPAVSKKL
ncbi:GGDEF domain-containing protein, partial [Methylobacterium sp. J-092]